MNGVAWATPTGHLLKGLDTFRCQASMHRSARVRDACLAIRALIRSSLGSKKFAGIKAYPVTEAAQLIAFASTQSQLNAPPV